MKLLYKALAFAFSFFLLGETAISQTIWSEDFTYPDGTVLGPAGKWSATCGACLSGDYFEVRNNGLHGSDVNDFSVWMSEVINISGCSDVSFSLSAVENGDHEGPGCNCGVNVDYFDVAYSIDGAAFQTIEDWNGDGEPGHTLTGDTQNGSFTDQDWQSTTVTQTGLSGNSLRLRMTIRNTAGSEVMILDDVAVECVPLPVEMVSLKAVEVEDAVEVRWETAMEVGSDHFEVERSHNGNTFFSIGQVAAKGHSEEIQNYHFRDASPIPGRAWYRLKQVDQDGSHVLTQVVEVQASGSEFTLVRLAPNPVSGAFQVALQSASTGQAELEIFDLMGQRVERLSLRLERGENRFELDGSGLAGGMYILQATKGTAVVHHQFLVQ